MPPRQTATSPPKELKLDLDKGVTMDLISIPPGKFTMGGDRKAKEGEVMADTPKHEVTLTKGFCLCKYEVTQAQYQALPAFLAGPSATIRRGCKGIHPQPCG